MPVLLLSSVFAFEHVEICKKDPIVTGEAMDQDWGAYMAIFTLCGMPLFNAMVTMDEEAVAVSPQIPVECVPSGGQYREAA
jgi:hypothetical protein